MLHVHLSIIYLNSQVPSTDRVLVFYNNNNNNKNVTQNVIVLKSKQSQKLPSHVPSSTLFRWTSPPLNKITDCGTRITYVPTSLYERVRKLRLKGMGDGKCGFSAGKKKEGRVIYVFP